MDNGSDSAKILAFKSKAPAPPSGLENSARGVYTNNSAGVKAKKTFPRPVADEGRRGDPGDRGDRGGRGGRGRR